MKFFIKIPSVNVTKSAGINGKLKFLCSDNK